MPVTYHHEPTARTFPPAPRATVLDHAERTQHVALIAQWARVGDPGAQARMEEVRRIGPAGVALEV
jgi:hypothetical protein